MSWNPDDAGAKPQESPSNVNPYAPANPYAPGAGSAAPVPSSAPAVSPAPIAAQPGETGNVYSQTSENPYLPSAAAGAATGYAAPSSQPKAKTKPVPWLIIGVAALLLVGGSAGITMLLNQKSSSAEPDYALDQGSGTASETSAAPSETEEAPVPATQDYIALPGCEAMNSAARQKSESNGQSWSQVSAGAFNSLAGPVAKSTLGRAKQVTGCIYPYSATGSLTQFVSEIDASGRSALVQAIQTDPDFAKSSIGPAQVNTWVETGRQGPHPQFTTTHIFIGDVWVAMFAPSISQAEIQAAVDGVLASNPQL